VSAQAPTTRWQVFPDGAALADQAAALILDAARAAITAHGVFHLVLAGGHTPKDAYERLREVGANWAKWQIYFGDERCLPRGDPERNDTMARTYGRGAAREMLGARPGDLVHVRIEKTSPWSLQGSLCKEGLPAAALRA